MESHDDDIIRLSGSETQTQPRKRTMSKEISVARKAIRQALKTNQICKEISGMHRVAIESIRGLCKNEAIATELAYQAAKDVLLG